MVREKNQEYSSIAFVMPLFGALPLAGLLLWYGYSERKLRDRTLKRHEIVFFCIFATGAMLSGCSGGGSTSTAPSTPLVPLPSGAFAIASGTTFSAVLPAAGILTDQTIQVDIAAHPFDATIDVAELDGTISNYAISVDQVPSNGAANGTEAATITLYSRADSLQRVRIEIANSFKRKDGTYFINGVLSIIRPSTVTQFPDQNFQFIVTNKADFIQQFGYSADAFAVSKNVFDSVLSFSFDATTR